MFLYHRERYDELMMKSYAEAFKCVTPDNCLIVICLITVLTDYSPHYNTCTCICTDTGDLIPGSAGHTLLSSLSNNTCTDIVPVYMYIAANECVLYLSMGPVSSCTVITYLNPLCYSNLLSSDDYTPVVVDSEPQFQGMLEIFPIRDITIMRAPFPRTLPFSSMVPQIFKQVTCTCKREE